MRILVINWRDIKNPEAGGAEVHLHEIFRRIAGRGHDVALLVHAFDGVPGEETIDGIRVFRRGRRNTFNFTVPFALRGSLDPARFDVVVDDLNKIPFYTPLYVRRPLLVILHHFFAESIFHEAPLPIALYVYLNEALVPLVYRRARFVTVSESSRQELVRRGIPAERVGLVMNAVDANVYRAMPPEDKTRDLIVYVGRLKKYKKIDLLIRAMRRVAEKRPGARLVIVGEGDRRPALESLARELRLNGRIEFAGFVSADEKVRLLQCAALSANPSPKEGWGVTVIEANACGTPVIAANVPGLRDAVVDRETGRLIPYGSEERLGEEIVQLLEDDAERARLSAGAVEWARRFSWDVSANEMLAALERVAAER